MAAEQPDVEKSVIKKLLAENRLQVDVYVKIVNQSDASKFKLLIRSQIFDPQDFKVKTRNNILTVEARSEERELDAKTIIKQNLLYEHELPKDVDPDSVKAYCPISGFLEIEAPRKR